MTRPSGVEIVSGVYAAARAGDWAAVEQAMADDFVIHEAGSLPYGGEYRGRDAFQRLIAKVMGYWRDPQVETVSVVGDDTHVVALLTFTMTGRATGRTTTQPVAEVTTLADGKLVEMRVFYFDAAEVAQAAG